VTLFTIKNAMGIDRGVSKADIDKEMSWSFIDIPGLINITSMQDIY
jgi:hypothetical protein